MQPNQSTPKQPIPEQQPAQVRRKRRLVQPDSPDIDEGEVFGQQEQRTLPDCTQTQVQTTSSANPSKKQAPKRGRGRPRKKAQKTTEGTDAVPEVEQEDNAAEFTAQSNEDSDEIVKAFTALERSKRESTALAYRKPLAEWRTFCLRNLDRFNIDREYPYTVGPTELVIAFFEDFVFKRTYMKRIPIGSDVRTQIYLQDEDEPSSSTTLPQLTEVAPTSKDGSSKILEIPIGSEAVKQYKKALMFLHEYQEKTRSITWPSPKKTKDLLELIKEYDRNLVYDQVVTNADRAAHCVIRDSYKAGQLIKILKYLWSSNNKIDLREMFSISTRHHMLLRDQDLRNLNFSDCFCTIIPKKQHRGTQQAVALVFCLDKGKTLKEGEVKFACAIRHENIFRCPVSAFAFFMFSLLQNEANFLGEERWHNWKVIRGRTSPEKSISAAQQYKTAKNAFAEHNIHTSRVTHGGRHAGAIEAEALGIPLDFIKRGGGWKDRLGRLETHYLGKLPSQFARGMAGFWDKPFYLSRNSVSPSIDLQRKIFPWIESYFGPNNAAWEKICEKEMREVDENEDEDEYEENYEEYFEERVEFIEGDGQMIPKKIVKGKKKSLEVQRNIDTAKRGFLRLLVRCRRVNLQDAAVYLFLKKENTIVHLKRSKQDNVFASSLFKQFQEDVIQAITTTTNNRLQEFEGLVPNIVDSQRDVSDKICELSNRIHRHQQSSIDQFTNIQTCLAQQQHGTVQTESVLVALSQQLQQISRNQQLLLVNEQCLNSQLQLMMATTNNTATRNNNNISGIEEFNFGTTTPNFSPRPPFNQPIQSVSPSLPVILPQPSPRPISPQIITNPAPTTTNNRNTAVSSSVTTSKVKGKGKATKWINYN